MTNFPLVSVIIPVYKVEQYLPTCVESLINQTYKNLEIILVDDGSPDNCTKLCDEYAEKDNRVKVIHKENGGLSDARNAGIESAKGEWLVFVDSDDAIHPQMIEFLIKAVLQNNYQVATCGYKFIPQVWNGDNDFVLYSFEKTFTESCSEKSLIEYMKQTLWTTAWAKIYKKDLFDQIKYPVGRLHEDEFTTYKVLYEAKKIYVIDLPFYFYRQRDSSIMANISEKNLNDTIDAYIERIDFFLNKNEIKLANFSYSLLLSYYPCLFIKPRNFASNYKTKRKCKNLIKKYKFLLTTKKDKIKYFFKLYFPKIAGHFSYAKLAIKNIVRKSKNESRIH